MKTKGYVFSIIVLTVILVGIAYVRALYSNQSRQDNVSPAALVVADNTPTDDYIKRDKLGGMIDSLRLYYIDSLYAAISAADTVADLSDNPPIDSIVSSNEELNRLIGELRLEVDYLMANNQCEFEKLVYRFYAGEMSSLPADLSKYEKNISSKEIKTKTNRYFNLKTGALDRIIEENK